MLDKKYKVIMFDLDGTSLNTDLYCVMNHAHMFLKYAPERLPSLSELVYFSGPSLEETFSKYLGEFDFKELKKEYVDWSKDHTISLSSVYNGEREVLDNIVSHGYKLGIVTNRDQETSEELLEAFDLAKYFDVVYGREKCEASKPDPRGLLKAIEEMKVNKDEVIYIGDSNIDISTARNAGVDSILVTWSLKKDLDKTLSNYNVSSYEEIERMFIDE